MTNQDNDLNSDLEEPLYPREVVNSWVVPIEDPFVAEAIGREEIRPIRSIEYETQGHVLPFHLWPSVPDEVFDVYWIDFVKVAKSIYAREDLVIETATRDFRDRLVSIAVWELTEDLWDDEENQKNFLDENVSFPNAMKRREILSVQFLQELGFHSDRILAGDDKFIYQQWERLNKQLLDWAPQIIAPGTIQLNGLLVPDKHSTYFIEGNVWSVSRPGRDTNLPNVVSIPNRNNPQIPGVENIVALFTDQSIEESISQDTETRDMVSLLITQQTSRLSINERVASTLAAVERLTYIARDKYEGLGNMKSWADDGKYPDLSIYMQRCRELYATSTVKFITSLLEIVHITDNILFIDYVRENPELSYMLDSRDILEEPVIEYIDLFANKSQLIDHLINPVPNKSTSQRDKGMQEGIMNIFRLQIKQLIGIK